MLKESYKKGSKGEITDRQSFLQALKKNFKKESYELKIAYKYNSGMMKVLWLRLLSSHLNFTEGLLTTFQPQSLFCSNSRLGEGHSKMMVLTKIMVVELNEGLDCLLPRTHLNQSHLAIFPEKR